MNFSRFVSAAILRILVIALIVTPLIGLGGSEAAPTPDLEEQTRALAAELRCVVCQNLSVADSPSEMAQQMRASVREQLEAGKSPQEIRDFFVSKYGEWVLLAPTDTGFNWLLWWLPIIFLIAGVIAVLGLARRWSRRKTARASTTLPADMAERLRSELANAEEVAAEDAGPRAALLREKYRLAKEVEELEFDYHAQKLSPVDYAELKHDVESRAAMVLQQLDALPVPSKSKPPASAPPSSRRQRQEKHGRGHLRRWQLAAGGTFILLFGLVLGIMLTQSIRPRLSDQDSMTGDFLTGTSAANAGVRSALEEGKRAFANHDFPKAIDAFKKALAADPENPEAHSYMGMILAQAGHGEGAMMAFDKALSQAPDFPMALWGKAMVLYRQNQDYDGARPVLQRLLQLIPPGEDRNEIEKILASFPPAGSDTRQAAPDRAVTQSGGQNISGRITIDGKLKRKLNDKATLFIIVRRAGGAAGPPVAVKKIERPVFPLSYSIGTENVMMQGTAFSGKVDVSVRLDADGDPATRAAGDLIGIYKNNPAQVGSKNIDIVIDQEL